MKGVAYVASALDSHWQRVGPALQSAVESELASRKGRLTQTVSIAWPLVSGQQHCNMPSAAETPNQELHARIAAL